jgi:uncharacterized membrane protein YfhO
VTVAEYAADRLRLSIDSADPVFVGTSVIAWRGWKLTVDGQRASLRPFDHAFLGFQVPAGRHDAVLRYLPDGVVAGAAISGLSVLLVAASLYRGRRRARAPEAPGPA